VVTAARDRADDPRRTGTLRRIPVEAVPEYAARLVALEMGLGLMSGRKRANGEGRICRRADGRYEGAALSRFAVAVSNKRGSGGI
jgi:hypothetical protein